MSAGPSPRQFILVQLTGVMLDCVVYACYVVLFGLAMHVSRNSTVGKASSDFWVLVALFVIGTIVVVCGLLSIFGSFFNNSNLGGILESMNSAEASKFNHVMIAVTQTGYALSNILADFIFLRRCYIVWNRNKAVIAIPIIISILSNALGIATIPLLFLIQLRVLSISKLLTVTYHANNMLTAFMAINAFSNTVFTSMIGGRIWWIMRQADRVGFSNLHGGALIKKQYLACIALILESGVLYPVTVIVFNITVHSSSLTPNLYPLMTLAAAIAPTLIMVRVNLGISINSAGQTTHHSSDYGVAWTGTTHTSITGSMDHEMSTAYRQYSK